MNMGEELTSQTKLERGRMKKAMGRLFVFEGPDGSGKTTFARLLLDWLRMRGMTSEYLAFPGLIEGTLGKKVYDLHHDIQNGKVAPANPTSLQLLHIAAHIDAMESTIIPILTRGEHVVLDRFWWSTWVYGIVGGAAPRSLRAMIDLEILHWGRVRPDLVFLIRRKTPLREEHSQRWQQLFVQYGKLAARERRKYPVCVIPNERPIQLVLDAITKEVSLRCRALSQNPRTPQPGNPPIGKPVSVHQFIPNLNIFMKLAPAKPTQVFETYWQFAAARQDIFFARAAGQPPPWTDDAILREYKFTNAYRASDRVSQFLIRNVIYSGIQTPEEVFLRTILFKLFNRIETWDLLVSRMGTISCSDYSVSKYSRVLDDAMARGVAIYSGAYIMPSGNGTHGAERKHVMHLKLVERMLRDELPLRLQECRSMRESFDLLKSYATIGDFLAYQYLIDLNYSTLLNFKEMEFVVPGPGAKDGIHKCFSDKGGLTDAEMIKMVAESQAESFEAMGITFRSLWGRPLQLVDCQNLFCEVDKYARIKHPDVKGLSGRSRIKQRFKMNLTPLNYWYPPKWGINGQIKATR